MDLRFSVLGLVVGFLVGMTGVGSGSLTTPALLLMGVPVVPAVASDLVYSALTKLVGAGTHVGQGTVNLRLAAYLSLGSVPAALFSGSLVGYLRATGLPVDAILTKMVAGSLVLVSAVYLADLLARRRMPELSPLAMPGAGTVLVGSAVGLIVGMTSVGSGSLVGAVLLYGFRLPARQVVGTDLVQSVAMVAAASVGHVAAGHVDLPLVLALLVGSIPGVCAGGLLTARVPARLVRGAVATAILVAGVRLFQWPG